MSDLVVDKCGLYLQYFENAIIEATKQMDCAKLEGKQQMMSHAGVLLQ